MSLSTRSSKRCQHCLWPVVCVVTKTPQTGKEKKSWKAHKPPCLTHKLIINTHLRSLEVVWAARFSEVPHKSPSFPHPSPSSFHLGPVVCLRCGEGGTLGQRKNWRNSCCWWELSQAATQWKPSHKCFPSIWELVTATLELRRFHVLVFFFYILTLFPPWLLCSGRRVVFRSFSKGGKSFFSNAQTGLAWLIVKWRNSWGWGFRVEGRREGGRERERILKRPWITRCYGTSYNKTHSYIKTKGRGEKKEGMRERGKHMTGCELKKRSSFQSQDKLWSDFKNLFSSYLLQLREVRRREQLTESYFMGFSLSPAGRLQHCCCLKPLEQGWHSSTLSRFHWLSQQLPINCYLPESLRAAGDRQEQRMEGDDDEGVRWRGGEEEGANGKNRERESQMRPGILCSLGTGCIWDSAFPYLYESEQGDRALKNRISGMPFMSAPFDLFPAFGSTGGVEEETERKQLMRER